MALRDFSNFLDGGLTFAGVRSKKYPDGKTYKTPGIDARTGLWLTAITDVGIKAADGGELNEKDAESLRLDDNDELNLYQRLLGPAYDEMVEDGVDWTLLQLIGRDAYLTFTVGQDVADQALADALQAAQGEPVAPQDGAPEIEARPEPLSDLVATQTSPAASPRKRAGSKSSPASSATRGRTRARTSGSTSKTPAPAKAKAG